MCLLKLANPQHTSSLPSGYLNESLNSSGYSPNDSDNQRNCFRTEIKKVISSVAAVVFRLLLNEKLMTETSFSHCEHRVRMIRTSVGGFSEFPVARCRDGKSFSNRNQNRAINILHRTALLLVSKWSTSSNSINKLSRFQGPFHIGSGSYKLSLHLQQLSHCTSKN